MSKLRKVICTHCGWTGRRKLGGKSCPECRMRWGGVIWFRRLK